MITDTHFRQNKYQDGKPQGTIRTDQHTRPYGKADNHHQDNCPEICWKKEKHATNQTIQAKLQNQRGART